MVVGIAIVTGNQHSAAQAAALVNAQTGRVTRAALSSTVDSSGSVSPESAVTLAFGVSGTVAKVNVLPGDHVKKDDVLAALDTSDLELQVAQQEQAFLIQQAAYSMTIQPDPDAVAAAQTAMSNASAALAVDVAVRKLPRSSEVYACTYARLKISRG
jgi:multidrug efflux pump subunit AcrA (membrane-fusion protein)